MSKRTDRRRVLIVGGGFAGLKVAQSLRKAPAEVLLVDRKNYHLFQPLLYQVATGTLSPANIAAPLRVVLRRQRNAEVVLGEVTDFDVPGRRAILSDGKIAYDTLVVAAGSRYNYFGHDRWQQHAPSLKTLEDATEIRRRILLSLEAAERETDPAKRRQWLTFVIVGGGPTGVELAGALAEIARYTLRRDFRHVTPGDATILLVEGLDRVLSSYPEELSRKAKIALEELGVQVQTRSLVTDVQSDGVCLKNGEKTQFVKARTVLWTAGVLACPLNEKLSAATGAQRDRLGRIMVEPDLSLPGHPEIFVIGDMAHVLDADGNPLPGMAPVAIQQGRYVGRRIWREMRGETTPPFRYADRGAMATIGRSRAVANLKFLRLSGLLAWILWLFVHLMQLVSFQNRVLVFIQWAWNYLTFNRSACLITERSAPPDESSQQPPDACA
ncbi:MAG: NAD(P)/FAD-dependent oxidoreductase [Pirellulales bacterium]